MSKIKETNEKVRKVVADYIVKQIDSNKTLPWNKPWMGLGVEFMPHNYSTKRPYKGSNAFILHFFTDWQFKAFLTLKQVLALGGRVKKEEFRNWTPIIFAKKLYWFEGKSISIAEFRALSKEDKKNVTGATMLRYFKVYNIEQTDLAYELPKAPSINPNERLKKAEKLMKAYQKENCEIIEKESNRAFYSPMNDKIVLPLFEQFNGAPEFYTTAFHEIVHSTGHKDRLNREGIVNGINKDLYSKEELVAEFGASFLSAKFGTFDNTKKNSAAYIKGWKTRIKDNPNVITDALADANNAVEFIENYC